MLFLQAADLHALCQWVLRLLQQYSQHARGRVSVAAAKRLRDAAEEDTYRDLRALLKLLTQLTNRDMLDFRDSTNGPAVDVAQVCWGSLCTLWHFKLPRFTFTVHAACL